MSKKFLLAISLLLLAVPAFAEEAPNAQALEYANVNLNKNFSGAYSSTQKVDYPQLENTRRNPYKDVEEQKVREVREIKKNTGANATSPSGKRAPMTYNSFPQNLDSSNMMMMQNGTMQGVGNMFGRY